MPVYEYECENCHEHFEKIQKFSDSPLFTCEKCGGSLKKLMSMTSFSLKGEGWYTTDYKRSPSKPATTTAAEPSPPVPAAPKKDTSTAAN